MNLIKKIFEDKVDEAVHRQFTKFGTGTYVNRAVYEITKGKSVKFKSTFEFCNELVDLIANNAKGMLKVSGAIVTNRAIESELKEWLVGSKKRMGFYTYEIQFEMDADKFKEFVNRYSNYYLLLTIETEGMSLKCKTKLPQPGSTKEDLDDMKVDFCVANFNDVNLLNDYIFDVKNEFKKLNVNHEFVIEDLIVPDEYKDDFVKARFYAKRKGKIVRHLNIDGRQETREHNLFV